MKVKKYAGNSTQEIMVRIKKELGSDAVVLNTRTINQKGFLGFLKKPLIEITAACEKKDPIAPNQIQNDGLLRISKQLTLLSDMVERITSDTVKKESEIPTELDAYRTKMVKSGIEYSVATSILERLDKQVCLKDKDEHTIREAVRHTLMEYIGQAEPLTIEGTHQKLVFFVGPTGVGKTTTLAKIAAQFVIEKKFDIGLITSDTYRVAAVEQLKAYSDILKLPLMVIYNEVDLYKALAAFKQKDIIFVDTAGKNHKDIEEQDEIFNIMSSIKNKEIYLVLSCTTEYSTLKSIIMHYNFISNKKIIFSKADESEGLGNILNTKFLTDNPVSYITTGQNVPEDIEILDKGKVVDCIIGEIEHE